MKMINIPICICVLFIILIGCRYEEPIETTKGRMNRSDEVQVPNTEPPDRTRTTSLAGYDVNKRNGLILEMVGLASGSVYPDGRILEFRALGDARVEFDLRRESGPLERVQVKLTPPEFKALTGRISKAGMSTFTTKYVGETPCFDSFHAKEIFIHFDGHSEQLRIDECRRNENDRLEPSPVALMELLQYIEEIKSHH
ncbi:MAG: hypothetical protein IT173_15955 [Acidobacteria bacterium]|nr:hypothetical protein [Acidobacteriota bacterium]